jgi:hypothetical protein
MTSYCAVFIKTECGDDHVFLVDSAKPEDVVRHIADNLVDGLSFVCDMGVQTNQGYEANSVVEKALMKAVANAQEGDE